MKSRIALSIGFCLALTASSLSAIAGAATLESYNQKYNTSLDEIARDTESKLAGLKARYIGALGQLLADVQSRGDLDLVKAVMAEQARFETAQDVTDEDVEQAVPGL